jgi:hypothetical protein
MKKTHIRLKFELRAEITNICQCLWVLSVLHIVTTQWVVIMNTWNLRLVTGFIGLPQPLITLHYHQFWQSAINCTTHWDFPICCPFTSPLVPISNGRRFSSRVPELYLCHSFNNSWLSVHPTGTPSCYLHWTNFSLPSSGPVLYLPSLVSPTICNSSCLAMYCNTKVILRPLVSRPVCLGVRHPSGTRDQFVPFLFLYCKLRASWCGMPSLTRRWIFNLLVQLFLGLARTVSLGSKSRRTYGHILLSHLRLPQPGGPGPCIYIPQEQGGRVIPPSTGFPLCRLLRLAGTTVEVF